MKVTYLQYLPSSPRVGQVVRFCDTQEGEYFILYGDEDWRVWTVRDNQEFTYVIKNPYDYKWEPWCHDKYNSHSDNTDESRMLIWSEDQVIAAGVPLLD